MTLPRVMLCVATMAWPAATARADVLELRSGGRIVGEINADAAPQRDEIAIDLPGGGRVRLKRADVSRAVEQSPDEQTYARRAAAVPDTADANWQLAEWCREHKLTAQADAHTRRVLELDPDHADARRAGGFSLHRGRWMTRDEVMESRGMVRYNGSFRTPQEVELLEREELGKRSAADWRKRLERWRRDLGSSKPEEVAAAADGFAQLTDPAAAGALVDLLDSELNPDALDLLIRAAANIEHAATVQALATLSLKSDSREVRRQCLEHLVRAGRPGLAEIYTRSLKSKDNVIVNRAAEALRVVADPATVGALIDALVTKHTFKVGQDTPQDTYSMNSSGTFNFGGGKAKTVDVTARNPEVRTALVELTGENFGFDQQAWNRWLAARATAAAVDLRRDE